MTIFRTDTAVEKLVSCRRSHKKEKLFTRAVSRYRSD